MSARTKEGRSLLAAALALLLLPACPGDPPAPPGPDAAAAEPGPDAGATDRPDAAAPAVADAAAEPADAGAGEPPDASAAAPDGGEGADAAPRAYQQLEGLRDQALKDALYEEVQGHAALDYDTGSKVAMTDPGGFDVIDGKVECIYSGLLFDPGQRDVEGGFNMEHSWPKSDGAGSMPMESDMNHLFPAERDINNARASYYFGDTDCTTGCLYQAGGSKLGLATGSTTMRVFQVRPERAGDIARAHFYFAVRYRMYIPNSEEAALRRWNLADPPDDRERARALAIEGHQKKRNPFVFRPDFVSLIADF